MEAIAIMLLNKVGGSRAAMAKARTMAGIARTISVARIITVSNQLPLKYPANNPKIVPGTTSNDKHPTTINRSYLSVYIILLRMSLP